MSDSIWDVVDREQGIEKEKPHRAENPKQVWVEWGLRHIDTVAIGFNNGVGSGEAWKLSRLLIGLNKEGLTDTQWGEALKLCRRYKSLLSVEEPQ